MPDSTDIRPIEAITLSLFEVGSTNPIGYLIPSFFLHEKLVMGRFIRNLSKDNKPEFGRNSSIYYGFSLLSFS
jgi:hypothetical protein